MLPRIVHRSCHHVTFSLHLITMMMMTSDWLRHHQEAPLVPSFFISSNLQMESINAEVQTEEKKDPINI